MPLFLSDDEFERHSNDAHAVAQKADEFITNLYAQLETVKAQADAASITAEQTCSMLEQKYISLSSDYSNLECRLSEYDTNLQQRASEAAQVQAEKHQFHLKGIEKDGELERVKAEVSELHKSKRQLMMLVEQKDAEISEKNSFIKSYLDKIVNLTENAAEKEARLSEIESKMARQKGTCERLVQEKEVTERHNVWLNEELTNKLDSLIALRRKNAEIEADMSAKVADVEKQYNECSSSLKWHKDRVAELEMKLTSLQGDLCSAKDAAAATEERYGAEIATLTKLVDLYKESSEEWSKKAGELEGVIKALEMHLSQVENEYKEKLEKEESIRVQAEKEVAELKEKLAKLETEIEASRKSCELNILPLGNFSTEALMRSFDTDDFTRDDHMIVPRVPAGVSGTALAASLLRDGWSLAQLYGKYQEAVDGLRHEQLGRKQTQAVLERVLLEIEEKASVILDERAEHEKMAEAYSHMNQKLQKSLSDQANMEKVILELKADLKRRERDYDISQKEIADLEKQVTVLLKECRDIQLRCGSYREQYADDNLISPTDLNADIDAEKVISEQLLTFRDINGLVEQNAKLRRLVRSFSDQIQNQEIELKEQFDMELQKHDEMAASKVALVLERAEEQGHMIESLHSSVAMYKRLYEEEHKLRSSLPSADAASASVSEDGRKDLMQLLHEGSQDSTKKIQQLGERLRCLEDELSNRRSEIILLRSERDKLALEAAFSHDKLERFMKEFDHQREETNAILARNVEFSQLVVDYQRRLRESSESLHAAEELSRKLNMEVSVLKNEKELLSNSEKRACVEVHDLSERVYRLQASLDTIQSTEQVHEESRAADKRKQEEYIKQLEREWAEAKKELQEERDNARILSHDREQTIKDAMRQLEENGKELASALRAVTAAEARASVAESRCIDLERNIKCSDMKGVDRDGGYEPSSSSVEIAGDMVMAKEEVERLKLEAEACKNHMHQYKSIAEVNEAALRQMESAHESFRIEADKMKSFLEAEIQSLRTRVSELENESNARSREAASAATEKEEAFLSAIATITALKEENATKMSQVATLETQLSSFKEDLEREQQRWRTAQANYERQVILQSETIQELTKTSQALASLQEEASELRREADVYRSENNQLKANWEVEKSTLEKSRDDFEKKYNEINEQNKILHNHLDAMHIKLAENDRFSTGLSSRSTGADSDSGAGLQSVVNYLRRSKEIAETEISLLKQEKLRLQSQVERASKEAEAAQASLNAERAKSSRSLFTDDEFKSLQHQVREINLLRESNMQLREENKHNFEECQKLRELSQKVKVEAESLQTLLREKEIEAEAARKETEMERTQKQHLEKRVSELLETYKSVDAEDYDRVKSDIKHLQAEICKKDAQIEEMRRLVVEKDDTIAKLEKDLSAIKSEQSERLQDEAKLKADLEKQRRLAFQLKRKAEALAKEKVSDTFQRELLSKGKEELSKENESLIKQLEDLKHGKKSATDATGEQATREKENEKDARIEILERTVRKLREDVKKEREDNKKEKDRRQIIEKAIQTKVSFVEQERKKIENEQEKHKEVVRRIANELEKLKHASDSLPEGTLVIQHLSGTALDDQAGAYGFAIENFEKSARAVLIELGAQDQPGSSSVMDSGAVSTGSGPGNEAPGASPSVPPAGPPAKTSEEKKKTSLPKTKVETRRFGRRLIRPHLGKSEQPLGDRDTEMSDIGGPGTAGKSASSQDTEADTNPDTSARKRTAASSAAELHGGSFSAAEMSTDVAGPASKRSKGSEHMEVDSQVETALPENAENPSAVDEPLDAADDFAHDIAEEGTSGDKDEIETTQEVTEEPGEHKQHDEMSQPDVPNQDENVLDENTDKLNEMDDAVDEESMLQAEQETQEATVDADNKEAILDADNKEEGYLVSEVPDPDGRVETSVPVVSQDATEGQTETPGASPMVSPARVDEETYVAATEDESEMSATEDSNAEQNEEGEITEDTAEMSDKVNNANLGAEVSDKGHAQSVGEADQISDANLGPPGGSVTDLTEATNSKESISSATVTVEEAKQPVQSQSGGSSTTINLNERARERSMLRLRELSPSPGGRGRGRPTTRAGRGRVRGRRQS